MSSSRRSRSRRVKRVLANIAVVLLGIIALLLLIGLFLPGNYRVARELEIRAPASTIYADLADLRRWPEWTVWNSAMDPTVQFTFDSPEKGVGATYRWTGDTLGRGALTLTQADPARGVAYRLEFDDGAQKSDGTIQFEPAGESVRVVWTNQGDLGRSPASRYFGLFIDTVLGPQLEQGLANLKSRAEAAGR